MRVRAESLWDMAEDDRVAESVQADTWKTDFANQYSLLFAFNCPRGILMTACLRGSQSLDWLRYPYSDHGSVATLIEWNQGYSPVEARHGCPLHYAAIAFGGNRAGGWDSETGSFRSVSPFAVCDVRMHAVHGSVCVWAHAGLVEVF